ncbi:GRXC6 [Symbiodinium sp. CCMP2592]|nr:GRXC6 [Symbiodinium sp. CCMP2592]
MRLPAIPDAALEQHRKIEKMLAGAGGELRLGTVEQLLNTQLHKQALTGFAISPSADGDRLKDLVRLTAKQACQLLEGPSLQMAYLEDQYFALGDAVLQAGLDFDNEERFRNTFEDFLAKREELRMAARRNAFIPYVPRTRAAKRSRKDLPPMTQFEKNLLQDIQRVLKARQASQSWISLSELLEDPVIRRARCKLPRGLALWEWLSLRCGDSGDAEITMVNERSDMLLQMVTASGPADALQMTLEERKQELSLAVFETLAILQRNFPDGGGLSLEDLQQVPAVARLQFGRPALQQALSRMKTVKVFARADGQQMVQLRPAAEVLGKEGANGRASSTQETKESEKSKPDKLAAKDAATNSQSKSTRPSSLSTSGSTRQAMQGFGPHREKESMCCREWWLDRQQQLPDRVPVTVEGWRRVQDQFFKGWPPLPDGWIRVISRSTGKVFFVDQHGGGVGQLELPQDVTATVQSAS